MALPVPAAPVSTAVPAVPALSTPAADGPSQATPLGAVASSAASAALDGLRSGDASVEWTDLAALGGGVALGVIGLLLVYLAWHNVCGRVRVGFQSCITVRCVDPADTAVVAEGAETELLSSGVPRSDVEAASSAAAGASMQPNWDLRGKVALVTGGSKGLGRAIVEELLSQGCEVLTCARDLAPLAALTGANPRCAAIEADVATPAGRQALLDTLRKRYSGNLDILVNNVGTNLRKKSHEYTEADYESLHATNQSSAFHLSRMCYQALRRRKGCIINVSSVSGSTVDNTGAPYHMNKAALEHMTRYLACEWGADGIRVNAIAPWFITTPLTIPLLKDARFHEAVRKATPLGRVGEPHEVACVVAFLAMPAAGYISGQVVGIDGAMMQEGFRYK